MFKIILPTLTVFCVLCSEHSCLLFKKGRYKTETKNVASFANDVDTIDNTTVPNTKYLKISAIIPVLHKGGVKNLYKLTNITLSSCGIRKIEVNAFENLPNLDRLNLKENFIEHVQSGVFNSLPISVLFLNKNHIKVVDPDAFTGMVRLQKIKLNSNHITVWDGLWFRNTPSLTEVYLRRNKIKELPENAFRNLRGVHLVNGSELADVKVFLSKNKIRQIHPKALIGIEKFDQLWLDRNKIYNISEDVFANVKQLNFLMLMKNSLISLPENLFKNTIVEVLDVTHNHNLTCIPLEIGKRVQFVQAYGVRNLDCNCVAIVQKQLKEINSNHLIQSDCDGE